MGVGSLGQEDPLEKGMATHSSILAWRIPPMEEPGGLQSVGLQRVGQDSSDLARSMHTELELELSHCISSSTQYGPAHLHVPPPLHHWLSREAGNSW